MRFEQIATIYEQLEITPKRTNKLYLVGEFFKETFPKSDSITTEQKELLNHCVLLFSGKIFPPYMQLKLGFSTQYVIKALSIATGYSKDDITKLWSEKGDLGIVAQVVCTNKRQQTLFSQDLTIEHIFSNLTKIASIEGARAVEQKVQLIAELLADANALEAKYIIRFVLEVMRAGIGESTLRDALIWAYAPKQNYLTKYDVEQKKLIPAMDGFTLASKNIFDTKKVTRSEFTEVSQIQTHPISLDTSLSYKKRVAQVVTQSNFAHDILWTESEDESRSVYNTVQTYVQQGIDMTNNVSDVALKLATNKIEEISVLTPTIGKPIKVMLAQKITTTSQAESTIGYPLFAEYKYDGFRMQIHKLGDDVHIFTRRLEDVTKQFPEAVQYIRDHILANECIIDSEAVGFDSQTKEYKPFQFISQRIRRKYDIEKLAEELPVEINVFDIIMLDGVNQTELPLRERRKVLCDIIETVPYKIRPSKGELITNEAELKIIYEDSLDAGNEGIMIKMPDAQYKPGSRVGSMLKLKPVMDTLDLVITKATWGEGKRASWFTSFTVCCIDDDGELFEVGKVSSGLKELEEQSNDEGILTFSQMTQKLKPLIYKTGGLEVSVKPDVIIEVAYEEIQKSSTYNSGYALRFPRILFVREARSVDNASNLKQIEDYYYDQKKRTATPN